MYLVAIGWMYVVVMMAVTEAFAPNGTVLGAVFTFLLYGCMPLAVVLYVLGTPARRRARQAREERSSERNVAATTATAPRDAASPPN